ncbi:hypothetical protein SAMN05216296_0047 [Pseudomonas pohangensis]|uniref:Uncharacterized protein n=1 Tax=Pseudomonas pohangensis TaxID=364197 RepID=A0A1H2DVH1_9PSED|nr:hypothetical protein [Pseudomonas pohangensis]SDT86794.1 hypothetical protein SAMN05216296_0047 [Pseudomonas pohangensis]
MSRIFDMSDEDLNRLRTNALRYLDDPKRSAEAQLKLDEIESELKRRYLPGMIQTFLNAYPEGFHDRQQIVVERDYKLAARNLCLELLGEEQFSVLLKNQDWAELYARAKRLINMTNLMQPSFEKPRLLDALQDPAKGPKFFTALYEVLWGGEEFNERFQHYCDTLEELDLFKWTYATYFVFLADSKYGMFVKPEMLKKSLEKSRYPLTYESAPTAALYKDILKFCHWLKLNIAELEPRDLIDVHSFMWHMAPTGKWEE